ncbi:NAD(P)-dependent oxidoreductase [Parafrankia sp. EUN1f]|uniref:NAD(P)-dependent oxidoreductase n=1 Tax=Parafrankia sp. EUN1f TaxID=102897 RepID=UPI0001C46B6A|nr:NAD(P)-dependent oxidoreductase [Parafrankia sp. EUN1f]EFC86275.1 6-phosphogluconate dehydrogenase NAD-binding [Parafrankia sp. EUN1f]
MRIAFLGLGRMGRRMARHVLVAGHELVVWNRTPGRAEELTSAGAIEAADPADAVRGAEACVLMLFDPESVAEVLTAVVPAAEPGALLINCTTVGPAAARELGRTAAGAGLRYLDAPVVGTVGPAEAGTLRILVGAADADLAAARSILEAFGDPERIDHVGSIGTASELKTVVNLALAEGMAAVAEVLRYGTDLGLDRGLVLAELAAGPLGTLVNYKRPMLESDDYSQAAFTVTGLAKDVRLATASVAGPLPVAEATLALTAAAERAGHTDDDFSAIAAVDVSGSNVSGSA